MADDNTLRSYRPNDPLRREAAPASERDRSNDPLVELARLIGQSDPFADIGRSNAREPDARQERVRPDSVRQDSPASAVPDWRGSPPPYALMRAKVAPSAPPFERTASAPMQDYADEHRYTPRYAPEPSYGNADPVSSHHDDLTYDDSNYAAAAQDGPEHEAPFYDDAAAAAEQDAAIYDDPPPRRRRSGMLTALTLIVCAMVGTAGAYGYRTYYVSPGPASTPVIVADKTPTKVVPASDAQSSKVIQDRVGDAAPAERVVTREEQPVILKVPTPPAAPPVFMAPTSPSNTASIADLAAATVPGAPPSAAAAPSPSGAASNEPKRVRTVTIRADGSDASTRPVAGTSTAPRAAAPAPKAARGGPLQLDPQQLSETETAPAAARPLTPPAPRLASAPATGGSASAGSYVVQVSSQKTETEAQASFRAMQAKYPTAFNGRSPIIRRADLGAKGVFYRALVGPFANAGDAGHFCSSLKAAGGQCIVQKN